MLNINTTAATLHKYIVHIALCEYKIKITVGSIY